MISAALTSIAFCLVVAALVVAIRSIFFIGREFSQNISGPPPNGSRSMNDGSQIDLPAERSRKVQIQFLKSGLTFLVLVACAALILLLRNWLLEGEA